MRKPDTVEINVRANHGAWVVYREYMANGLVYSRKAVINHRYKTKESAQKAAESYKLNSDLIGTHADIT